MGRSRKPAPLSEQGFTIVELLIATAVFSVVLLIITYGVLHFTNSYYKGVNTSATQTATQNIMDTISQAIQFSHNDGTSVISPTAHGSDSYFCAGNKEFVYTPGQEYMGDEPGGADGWGFYVLPQTSGGCVFPTSADQGTELLSKHMRIANLAVENPSDGFWSIALTVAYGDADLLCNTSIGGTAQGSCQSGAGQYSPTALVAVITSATNDAVQCQPDIGSQFCAVANLNTAIGQRIDN